MNARFGDGSSIDRAVESWLDRGPTTLSSAVIERTRTEVQGTRRPGAWRATWRSRPTLSHVRRSRLITGLALAAAVVALVGVGLRLAPDSSVGHPASPSPTLQDTYSIPPGGPSTFVPTGSMATGRIGHTATRLPDGRVLIAGGSGSLGDGAILSESPLTATAELYDPARGVFSPTGSMVVARAHHTATSLADGQVLITGGGNVGTYGGGFALDSAELFDPSTGRFALTGPMHHARLNAAVVRLADGRVLVAGGSGPLSTGDPTASAELYDAATGTFASTGSMAAALWTTSGFALPDGRALVYGDVTSGAYAPAFEIYDPATGTFGPMIALEYATGTATVLGDGRVLFVEGDNHGVEGASPQDIVSQVYDPTTGSLGRPVPTTIDFQAFTATVLGDGRVLLVGFSGRADEGWPPAAMLFDPAGSTFVSVSPPAAWRRGHTATLLVDGRVLIVGGGGDVGRAPTYATAELFQ